MMGGYDAAMRMAGEEVPVDPPEGSSSDLSCLVRPSLKHTTRIPSHTHTTQLGYSVIVRVRVHIIGHARNNM